MNQVLVIEIEWYGPFSVDEILNGNKKIFNNIGVYQIYGTHPVNGGDNLLYIGHTTNNFKTRLRNHYNDWIKHEMNENRIYLGVIWNEDIDVDKKSLFIKEAENLLTYYCAPAYNSHLIYDIQTSKTFLNENIIVLNLWQKHLLPFEVSTLWYYSNCWDSKRQMLNSE